MRQSLHTPEDVDALLRNALEDADNDPDAVDQAIGIIERAGHPLPSWWTDAH